MRAAQYFGNQDIRVVDVPEPTPQGDEVLVSIEWGGICGTDLHEYLVGPRAIPTKEPHPIGKALMTETTGVTMGHEFCGRIKYAPSGSPLKVGQAVMVDPRLHCRSCEQCNAGATNACHQWGFLGIQATAGGGFSETVAVDPSMCYELPDSVPLHIAALIEPLVVATHALNTTGVTNYSNHSVLVLGGGPIGIATIYCLKAKGVGKLLVSEPTVKRREQVEQIGGLNLLDPTKENVGDKCRSLTGGQGVSLVFDCAGVQRALDSGIDALRYGGLYMNVAGWETPFVLPYSQFMRKELDMKAAFAYTAKDFRETVDAFVAGKYKGVERMVTSRISLEDIAAKGFRELVDNKDYHVKILITPKKELV